MGLKDDMGAWSNSEEAAVEERLAVNDGNARVDDGDLSGGDRPLPSVVAWSSGENNAGPQSSLGSQQRNEGEGVGGPTTPRQAQPPRSSSPSKPPPLPQGSSEGGFAWLQQQQQLQQMQQQQRQHVWHQQQRMMKQQQPL